MSASAELGEASIAPITTTIESAGTGAHQGPVSRSIQAGRGRGAGRATSVAWASPKIEIESQNGTS